MKYRFYIYCPGVSFDYIYRKNIKTGLKYCYKQLKDESRFIELNEEERSMVKIIISEPMEHESKYFIRKNFNIYNDVKTIDFIELLKEIES